jgi:hypothetical protein
LKTGAAAKEGVAAKEGAAAKAGSFLFSSSQLDGFRTYKIKRVTLNFFAALLGFTNLSVFALLQVEPEKIES